LNVAEDQAGFLVGALGALMTRSNKIGAVCDADANPAARRYVEGYKAGAAFADQFKGVTTEVSVTYDRDFGASSSSTDHERGAATATFMMGQGMDVVFGCGGMTGDGAITEAAQAGAYAIGVETDQYLTLPEASPRILSSAIKLITPGVFELIKLSKDGQFPSGNYFGEVGYAPYHDLANEVPISVRKMMEQIRAGLLNGSIKTNVAPTDG
jgi:basic membrane protein A